MLRHLRQQGFLGTTNACSSLSTISCPNGSIGNVVILRKRCSSNRLKNILHNVNVCLARQNTGSNEVTVTQHTHSENAACGWRTGMPHVIHSPCHPLHRHQAKFCCAEQTVSIPRRIQVVERSEIQGPCRTPTISQAKHDPNALPPSPAADPSSGRSTFKHLLVLHQRCNMFEPSFLRHFPHNTPLTAFLTISAVSFTYSLLHPQASRLDMSCTRKVLPGR